MRRLTKHWSRLAIASSGIDGLVGCERLNAVVRPMETLMAKKLDLVEAPANAWPICPHCKKELKFIWVKSKGLGFIERKQFLLCPHCRCFLGFGNINFT